MRGTIVYCVSMTIESSYLCPSMLNANVSIYCGCLSIVEHRWHQFPLRWNTCSLFSNVRRSGLTMCTLDHQIESKRALLQDTKAHHITIGKPVKLTPLLDAVIKLVANDVTGIAPSKILRTLSINGASPHNLELEPKLRSMLKILIAEVS